MFSILTVCTGNICRSPAAQLLLQQRFLDAAVDGVAVASAGTAGLDGHPMDVPSAYALNELGVDGSRHAGRRLEPELIAKADLILTATAEHRSVIVQADPLSFRRTFTLREFARLGAQLDLLPAPVTPEALRARVSEVAGQRGWVEPGPPGSDDIADPHGAGLEVARATVVVIDATVREVVRALGVDGRVRAGED